MDVETKYNEKANQLTSDWAREDGSEHSAISIINQT